MRAILFVLFFISSTAFGYESSPYQYNLLGAQINPATSDLQTSGNSLLSSIITALGPLGTASNQSLELAQLTAINANTASALNDITNSGNITAACTVVSSCTAASVVSVSSQGQYTVGFSITGTFVASYLTEGQNQDGTWTVLPMFITTSGAVPYPSTNALTGVSQFLVIGGAYQNIRVRASAYTSGTIAVSMDASIAQQAVFSSQMGVWSMRLQDGAGNLLTSGSIAGVQRLNVDLASSGADNTTAPAYATVIGGVDSTGKTQALDVDTLGRPLVVSAPVDGYKASYSSSNLNIAPGLAATDLYCIKGSATKILRVLKIRMTATQTTSGTINVLLIKRSTANTAGTSTAGVAVPHDSTDVAATGSVLAYTANPTTLGTTVGNFRTAKIFASATTAQPQELIWQFGDLPGKAIVLRGVAESACVNLNGVTPSGGSFDIATEWTEE